MEENMAHQSLIYILNNTFSPKSQMNTFDMFMSTEELVQWYLGGERESPLLLTIEDSKLVTSLKKSLKSFEASFPIISVTK